MITKKIYFILITIFYPLIFVLKLLNIEAFSKFCIPIFVFIVFLNSLNFQNNGNKNKFLISVALLFAFIGDTFINLTNLPQLCIIFFSITHLALMYYYFKLKSFTTRDLSILILLLILGSVLYFILENHIKNDLSKYIFIGYLGILSLMLWRAFCLIKKEIHIQNLQKIIVGSLLFYLTDIIVCFQLLFHQKFLVLIIWLIYPAALILLSFSNRKVPV